MAREPASHKVTRSFHHLQVLAVFLLLLNIAACASERFVGYQLTQRDGWLFYELDGALLPPLPADYADPGPPSVGVSSTVQRELVHQARDFAQTRLQVAGLCPNGFSGPDQVLRNRETRSLQFRVRCQ